MLSYIRGYEISIIFKTGNICVVVCSQDRNEISTSISMFSGCSEGLSNETNGNIVRRNGKWIIQYGFQARSRTARLQDLRKPIACLFVRRQTKSKYFYSTAYIVTAVFSNMPTTYNNFYIGYCGINFKCLIIHAKYYFS